MVSFSLTWTIALVNTLFTLVKTQDGSGITFFGPSSSPSSSSWTTNEGPWAPGNTWTNQVSNNIDFVNVNANSNPISNGLQRTGGSGTTATTTPYPWAPGGPETLILPGGFPFSSPCQTRECGDGFHCTFAFMGRRRLCPLTVRGVPCRCTPGCRVGNTYIAPRTWRQGMDRCGNRCSCSPTGRLTCSNIRCR